MKVAIVGSRNYGDLSKVREFVMGLPGDTIVVSGGAQGVDSVAERAARSRGLQVVIFAADWKQYGKKAGLRRNYDIVQEAEWIYAFWDGISTGTAHTIKVAREQGKEVTVFQ